jgi:hypothetical protein
MNILNLAFALPYIVFGWEPQSAAPNLKKLRRKFSWDRESENLYCNVRFCSIVFFLCVKCSPQTKLLVDNFLKTLPLEVLRILMLVPENLNNATVYL